MHDSLTDVPGILVGQWTDLDAATGCTVVLCPPEGAVAAYAQLGGAPGTRETDLLSPGNVVQRAHAVLLTGGSAYGLDAAGGVMRWLEEAGRGYETKTARVPIVPAAVIYDLGVGRADVRPDAAAGYAACEAAGRTIQRGTAGAGTGATVAKLAGLERAVKGGTGTASESLGSGGTVGALAIVNTVGEIIDPETGVIAAAIRTLDGEEQLPALEHLRRRHEKRTPVIENTTVAVVATDIALDRTGLLRVALMAHSGMARTMRPSHSPADGDTVFALSTALLQQEQPDIMAIGALAARALERAILDGVRRATSLAGYPACGAFDK